MGKSIAEQLAEDDAKRLKESQEELKRLHEMWLESGQLPRPNIESNSN